MTENATGLLQAVLVLKRSAEAGFQGKGYELASNDIAALLELLGAAPDAGPSRDGADYSFADALAAVRKGIESELSGNKYYIAANHVDALAAFLPPAESAIIAPKAPAIPESDFNELALAASRARLEELSSSRPSFADISAASKARVERVAADLGIAVTHQPTAPVHAGTPETLADGELERRSSEPCAMAGLSPIEMEPVAAAPISAESAAEPGPAERSPDLGSPAFKSESSTAQRPVAATAKESHAEAQLQAAPAGDDRKAGSAGEAVNPKSEDKPQAPKSLFNLWLDIMFGRKN